MIQQLAAAVLLSSALVGAHPAGAAEDAKAPAPALAAQAPECDGGPAAVVAGVLQLTPEQVQALGMMLHARQQALEPILREIAVREQRIRELVASGGNPAEIGLLMLQVHQLRQAAEAAQVQFLTAFAGLLGEEQRQRWEQVRLAARLQPVVPAFAALQLL